MRTLKEELGVASSLEVKQITDCDVTNDVNKWLAENPNKEVLEMKFTTAATEGEWVSDVLIIFRKEKY
ncbi:hypothetical protein [Microbulbifer pacificus]|uniref:hypothetical protein n=1 Tax=Microbulbifer pacificus TaxID=407164 RepID=UPI00131A3CC8|nr:hypothetical protein [Microbulbifer pacificus]